MARILGVGNAIRDIICEVESFPDEDSESRALSREVRLGGNVANTLTVLSGSGHHCGFAGVTTAGIDGQWIIEQLVARKIDTFSCIHFSKGTVPTSYILLNRQNGSRTITHFRDLPEYNREDFMQENLHKWDWIHFEGRNCSETRLMLEHIKKTFAQIRCSVEIEKNRENIQQLFEYADILIFSKDYVSQQIHSDTKSFLKSLHEQYPDKTLVGARGSEGAVAIDATGIFIEVAAFQPEKTVDTLGAGDVFNAGLISELSKNKPLETALHTACRIAGIKCGQSGLKDLIIK